MSIEVETRRLNEDFEAELEDLVDLVESYRSRKFDEDLALIKEKFDGMEGLARKLITDLKDGLKGDDFPERDKEFGDNK